MALARVEEQGLQFVEGRPDAPFVTRAADAVLLVEACLSEGVDAALLYPANLPPAFFDVSSGQAGELLQKLRNYRLRLAVVAPPGAVQFSSRFGDLLADERRGPHFDVLDSREAALAWLAR